MSAYRDEVYDRLAEQAAMQAERNLRDAAIRRGSVEVVIPQYGHIRLATPLPAPEEGDARARLAELAERERALVERERLVAMVQADVDRSRKRLDDLLRELNERRPSAAEWNRADDQSPPAYGREEGHPSVERGDAVFHVAEACPLADGRDVESVPIVAHLED